MALKLVGGELIEGAGTVKLTLQRGELVPQSSPAVAERLAGGERIAAPASVVPTLVSASLTATSPVCGVNNWVLHPAWTTTNANDTDYQINLDVSTEQTPVTYNALVTGQTTVSSSYDDDTLLVGDTAGVGSTAWRTYKVKLVRKADSVVIDTKTTTTETVTYGPCV